jgi:hypothetical protein
MQNAIQNSYTQIISVISSCVILISEFSLSSIVALHLSRALYKPASFMRNKPNFRKAAMNTTSIITRTYENKSRLDLPKNKPNQTQFLTQKTTLCKYSQTPILSLKTCISKHLVTQELNLKKMNYKLVSNLLLMVYCKMYNSVTKLHTAQNRNEVINQNSWIKQI